MKMTGEECDRRDSRALEPELITDPQAKAVAEARNGFRQYDAAISAIQSARDRGSFKLRPSLILGLQREALAGISSYEGNYRPGGVAIEGSKHEPVGAHLVPELVEDMCDYVNEHWETSTPIHLAAYLMRRLNWIHPFADGNGRTSRIISYVVLSIRAGSILPGAPTIPDCRQSQAVFRRTGCGRFGLPRRQDRRFENGRAPGLAARKTSLLSSTSLLGASFQARARRAGGLPAA
jgi:hypothetical protein